MISNDFNFLLTGTRCFCRVTISQIDLWHTDQNVRLVADEKSIILDEDESRTVRRWHELAIQAAVADGEDLVIRRRIERQEQVNAAEKLNRATAKKNRKRVKTPAAVVDMATWKIANRSEQSIEEPCSLPAA